MSVRSAIAFGHLYALPFGYPAMTVGSGIVRGFLLSFHNPECLTRLDRFEQHDPSEFRRYKPDLILDENQYERKQIEVVELNQNRQVSLNGSDKRFNLQIVGSREVDRGSAHKNLHNATLQTAWVYLMTTEQVVRLGGVPLPDGEWNPEKQRAAFSAHSQH